MMPTTTRPRQLTRDDFIRRCRELFDEGLTQDQLAEKLLPIRPAVMSESFVIQAIETITAALAIADEVSNAKMVQGRLDFINYERRAQEEAHLHANRCAHVESAYADPSIRRAKRAELDATRDKYRAAADQAAEDWTRLQRRRIQLDDARKLYPTAFSDFSDWEPTPVK